MRRGGQGLQSIQNKAAAHVKLETSSIMTKFKMCNQFNTFQAQALKRVSKKEDSSKDLEGLSNKDLYFIFVCNKQALKIQRQGRLSSVLLLKKISLVVGMEGKDKVKARRPIRKLKQ